MKTEPELLELAFELFAEVHARLGHDGNHGDWITRKGFDNLEPRKAAWIEIARALEDRVAPTGRWLDDYAITLYHRVHERLKDGHDLIKGIFKYPEVHRAWYEIARALAQRLEVEEERNREAVGGARVLIVSDGERWYVRRVASVMHDGERDEMVYRCDEPLGGPYEDPNEALAQARAAHFSTKKRP